MTSNLLEGELKLQNDQQTSKWPSGAGPRTSSDSGELPWVTRTHKGSDSLVGVCYQQLPTLPCWFWGFLGGDSIPHFLHPWGHFLENPQVQRPPQAMLDWAPAGSRAIPTWPWDPRAPAITADIITTNLIACSAPCPGEQPSWPAMGAHSLPGDRGRRPGLTSSKRDEELMLQLWQKPKLNSTTTTPPRPIPSPTQSPALRLRHAGQCSPTHHAPVKTRICGKPMK